MRIFLILSVVTSFISLCFFTFSIVFPKISLFIKLKKSFSKSFFTLVFSSVYISIYDFSQAFWLNLITVWIFFKNNSWFNACFKCVICVTYSYSVLSHKLATSFSTFSIFFLSSKYGNPLWRLCKFLGHWTTTSRKYPSSLSLL